MDTSWRGVSIIMNTARLLHRDLTVVTVEDRHHKLRAVKGSGLFSFLKSALTNVLIEFMIGKYLVGRYLPTCRSRSNYYTRAHFRTLVILNS